ncbi:unnamed protein product [Brassicogethes aeneus]|uniref:Calcyclin-binding protein n=1 Tax=Brassicogethes aeneus TaxID=1431903 RepID=A0A9P0FLQ0_BRAAE|nr:unnamed protein product [Brassicogethes aeneus]
MQDKIDALKLDIAELESFENQSTRQKVKDILSIERRRLVSEVLKLEEQSKPESNKSNVTTVKPAPGKYQVKVNNYAWDQTSKFVKFYVTLKNVQNIPLQNVKCKFTTKSLELLVEDLDKKDYVLTINNLLKEVVPEDSSWKVKTDMVIVSVAKKSQDTWSHVTGWEKKTTEPKSVEPDADPADGIMSLMKNMYDKGDDEMKRTIAKAWTESQSKGSNFQL